MMSLGMLEVRHRDGVVLIRAYACAYILGLNMESMLTFLYLAVARFVRFGRRNVRRERVSALFSLVDRTIH